MMIADRCQRRRGRPPKLTNGQREKVKQAIFEYTSDKSRMKISNGLLARQLEAEGISVSTDYIRRVREELGVKPYPRGGPRTNAGRPRGSFVLRTPPALEEKIEAILQAYERDGRMTLSDSSMAALASEQLGIKISYSVVRRLRRELRIRPKYKAD